jgi:predicted transcriptional regulator
LLEKLPPRERQIVDLLYTNGRSTVSEVRSMLPVPLSDQAVRAMLVRLEKKGFVQRSQSDAGLVFFPAVPESKARQSALKQLVTVFFGGSSAGAANALLGMSDSLSDAEIDTLDQMLARARERRK